VTHFIKTGYVIKYNDAYFTGKELSEEVSVWSEKLENAVIFSYAEHYIARRVFEQYSDFNLKMVPVEVRIEVKL